jgi:hypothetical protein
MNKTSSISTVKEAIVNFFNINRSLAGTISKWTASNTATTLMKNSLNMLLTSDETQTTFASQLNKS